MAEVQDALCGNQSYISIAEARGFTPLSVNEKGLEDRGRVTPLRKGNAHPLVQTRSTVVLLQVVTRLDKRKVLPSSSSF